MPAEPGQDSGEPANPVVAYLSRLIAAALADHDGGRLAAAEAKFATLLVAVPVHPGGVLNIGFLRLRQGDPLQAARWLRRALVLQDQTIAIDGLATALLRLGRHAEVVALLRPAVTRPDAPMEMVLRLAAALRETGAPAEAVECLAAASRRHPDAPALWHDLTVALLLHGDDARALDSCRRQLRLRPDDAHGLSNLGSLLRRQGELQAARTAHRRATRLDPALGLAHYNLGLAERELGAWAAAEAALRQAVAIDPMHESAHVHLSQLLLLQGKFAEGWREFDWRRNYRNFRQSLEGTGQTLWDGRSLPGQPLMVAVEGGFGDLLQFARYLPTLRRRVGRIDLVCRPGTAGLLAHSFGQDGIVYDPPRDDRRGHMTMLLSLPHLLGEARATPDIQHPYLQAPPDAVQRWRQRLAALPGLRVGLCWAGSDGGERGDRSIPLADFSAVLAVPGVSFVALQFGPAKAQLATVAAPPLDWTGDLVDFSESAGLVSGLDLVITVDTAAVHLAGGLGVPTWCLISAAPDFRWLLGREDTPLYPSVRLFRQSEIGDWTGPLRRVVTELGRLTGGHASAPR